MFIVTDKELILNDFIMDLIELNGPPNFSP